MSFLQTWTNVIPQFPSVTSVPRVRIQLVLIVAYAAGLGLFIEMEKVALVSITWMDVKVHTSLVLWNSIFSNKLVDVIEFQGLADSLLFVNVIKLKMNLTTYLLLNLNTLYSKRWILKKTWIENIVQTFKQLSPLQAIGELRTAANH